MIDGIGRASPQAAVGRAPPPRTAVTVGNMPAKVSDADAVSRVAGAAPVVGQGLAASNLGRIGKDLAASPPVDAAKVATLKAAIASGDYRPDPAKIAERMLALETVPPKR